MVLNLNPLLYLWVGWLGGYYVSGPGVQIHVYRFLYSQSAPLPERKIITTKSFTNLNLFKMLENCRLFFKKTN